MNKNEQLAQQSLEAQQGFFGNLTDVESDTLPAAYSEIQISDGWEVDGNGVVTRSEPIPACLQLHMITPTIGVGSVFGTKFDTQGPYGRHVYGLPVLPTLDESIDDIRYKKPNPEEYGWEPNSTTSSNGWPDEESRDLYEETMLEWKRALYLVYGRLTSQNTGAIGAENPEEEIQKLREQFKELITDNAAGTYKRGHNGQLIADEVCVEGLIDDLVEFLNQQEPQ